MLKSLSEPYACRAREFSDTVALLGRHNSVEPEVVKLLLEIKRQLALCVDAEERLEHYMRDQIENSNSAEFTIAPSRLSTHA